MEDSDEKTSSIPELQGWSPLTTRLLCEGGSNAWNVIDNVMPMNFADNQKIIRNDFCTVLNEELETSGILNEMTPAKTYDTVQRERVLEILQRHNFLSNDTQQLLLASNDSTTSARGDTSVFVGREWQNKLKHLSLLVQTITTTIVRHLHHELQFDLSKTSIQLAEYPGNGLAGYPKHCDCHDHRCGQPITSKNTTLSTTHTTSDRIITAVYYLTPNNWKADADGGCLRLFTDNHNHFDVVPYRNRLVVFRSDGVEHQVLPSVRRPRRAITVWLYGTEIKTGSTTITDESAGVKHSNTVDYQSPVVHNRPSQGPPPLPIAKETMDEATIFVSMVSYRDSETGPTIRNLFETAAHPNRIYVGLVLQIDTFGDAKSYDETHILDRLPIHESWYQRQVRCLTMDARHATGPCPARALCQSLRRSEEYVLQIDSHMRFRKHWDSYLIEQLSRCQTTNKPMISTYPSGYQLPNHIPNEIRGTLLRPWKFDTNGMLRQKAQFLPEPLPTRPLCHHLYAAGFNFCRASVIRDCPYDPNLHHLFFGEEQSMALRLYQKGYDIFTPPQAVCFHLWNREYRPTPLQEPWMDLERVHHDKERSQQVVRNSMVDNDDTRELNNDNQRTAKEFGFAIGVDFSTQTILSNDKDQTMLEDVNEVEKKLADCEPS